MANHYVLILGATWRENTLPRAHLAVIWWVTLTQQSGGQTAIPPAGGGALTWECVTFQEQKSAV